MSKKLTIDTNGYDLIARDKTGRVMARRQTGCETQGVYATLALEQLLHDCRLMGAEIDWDNSLVAKPVEEMN